ncbi:MAG: hypothetical protein H6Q31_3339 [Bacteroidetes bacterium]|nr:hypothetical protein [Bacteroidota bacterium]
MPRKNFGKERVSGAQSEPVQHGKHDREHKDPVDSACNYGYGRVFHVSLKQEVINTCLFGEYIRLDESQDFDNHFADKSGCKPACEKKDKRGKQLGEKDRQLTPRSPEELQRRSELFEHGLSSEDTRRE